MAEISNAIANALTNSVANSNAIQPALQNIVSNPAMLGAGISLIIAAIVLLVFLRRIILNTLLGIVAWAIVVYAFKIQLPLVPSLIVSMIFGLAGIGVMLILKFLGVPLA